MPRCPWWGSTCRECSRHTRRMLTKAQQGGSEGSSCMQHGAQVGGLLEAH